MHISKLGKQYEPVLIYRSSKQSRKLWAINLVISCLIGVQFSLENEVTPERNVDVL